MFKNIRFTVGGLFFLVLSNFIGSLVFPEMLIVTWITLILMAFCLAYLIIQLNTRSICQTNVDSTGEVDLF